MGPQGCVWLGVPRGMGEGGPFFDGVWLGVKAGTRRPPANIRPDSVAAPSPENERMPRPPSLPRSPARAAGFPPPPRPLSLPPAITREKKKGTSGAKANGRRRRRSAPPTATGHARLRGGLLPPWASTPGPRASPHKKQAPPCRWPSITAPAPPPPSSPTRPVLPPPFFPCRGKAIGFGAIFLPRPPSAALGFPLGFGSCGVLGVSGFADGVPVVGGSTCLCSTDTEVLEPSLPVSL